MVVDFMAHCTGWLDKSKERGTGFASILDCQLKCLVVSVFL